MQNISFKTRTLIAFGAFVMLSAATCLASDYSVSVGGGTLSWEASYNSDFSSCTVGSPGGLQEPIGEWAFSDFSYKNSSGQVQNFNSTADYLNSPGGNYCPPTGPQPSSLPLNGSGYTIHFTPENGGEGSATITY